MEVFVDEVKVDAGAVRDGTLEEALRLIQAEHCTPGHLVVALRCDGAEVASDTMVAKLAEPVADVKRLDVFTSSKQTLVIETMARASASLDETAASCQRIAELLQQGQTSEAVEALGRCLHVWQQIHEALSKSIEMLGMDPQAVTVGDLPLMEAIAQPKQVLLQIKEALMSRDYVMLSDILQYEFGETTDLWHRIVARIRTAGEEGSATSDAAI